MATHPRVGTWWFWERGGEGVGRGGEARGTAGGLRGGIAGRHSGVDHGLLLQARCVHTAGGRAARRGGAERNGGGGGQRQAQDSAAGTHARMACGEHCREHPVHCTMGCHCVRCTARRTARMHRTTRCTTQYTVRPASECAITLRRSRSPSSPSGEIALRSRPSRWCACRAQTSA